MTRSAALDKSTKQRRSQWLGCIVTLALFASLLLFLHFVLFPAMSYSREAARCVNCRNNMHQIGIALQHYHQHHGAFPPAYTVDAEGNPLHSWRTLILPYFAPGVIEPKWKEIYGQIRFDEPWDSEHNRQFHEFVEHATEEERQKYHSHDPDHNIDYGFHHNMPAVFGCPNHSSGSDVVETVYKMVVGDNAVGNVRGTSASQITRPLGETILVVEALLPVPWMSPLDFTVEDFQTAVYPYDGQQAHEIYMARYDRPPNRLAKRQILGGHYRELHILLADGTVKRYWVGQFPPISEIEAMSRIRE